MKRKVNFNEPTGDNSSHPAKKLKETSLSKQQKEIADDDVFYFLNNDKKETLKLELNVFFNTPKLMEALLSYTSYKPFCWAIEHRDIDLMNYFMNRVSEKGKFLIMAHDNYELIKRFINISIQQISKNKHSSSSIVDTLKIVLKNKPEILVKEVYKITNDHAMNNPTETPLMKTYLKTAVTALQQVDNNIGSYLQEAENAASSEKKETQKQEDNNKGSASSDSASDSTQELYPNTEASAYLPNIQQNYHTPIESNDFIASLIDILLGWIKQLPGWLREDIISTEPIQQLIESLSHQTQSIDELAKQTFEKLEQPRAENLQESTYSYSDDKAKVSPMIHDNLVNLDERPLDSNLLNQVPISILPTGATDIELYLPNSLVISMVEQAHSLAAKFGEITYVDQLVYDTSYSEQTSDVL